MRRRAASIRMVLFLSAFLAASGAWGFSAGKKDEAKPKSSVETVWVFKSDGSKQCQPDSGQSLDAAAQELTGAGVTVLSSKKVAKIHAQLCGLSSGQGNAYEIPRDDEGKAIKLGFQKIEAP